MTVHQNLTVQRGIEISVPLNKLKKSPRNARRTPHAQADVEALAASISVKGLLQPPVVEAERDAEGGETGAYLVTIGEGRRLALSLLVKRKEIAKTAPVRCLLDGDNDAFEISLDENVTRFAMHPADQFEAFRNLAEAKGWSAEEVGARFGVSAQTVRQRLKLGAVSPVLLAAYRAAELTLDQLMAFAVSEDHTRQEQVFSALSYNRSPALIRRLLTEHEIEASDRRSRFVGHEAYETAGGLVRRDLFADDHGGWFTDVALLDQLVLEKLSSEAKAVKLREGWQWAEAHLDCPRDHGLRRVYPHEVEPDETTKTHLFAIAAEYDGLIAGLADADRAPTETEARLRDIEAELEAASRPVFDPDVRARSGVFVVLDWEGVARIERGFMRPQDGSAPEGFTEASGDDEAEAGGQAEGHTANGAQPLSDRLVADLSAHRTAALRDSLASQPSVALLTALHAVVLQTFYYQGEGTCLQLRAAKTELDGFADAYRESVAGRAIEGRHEAWGMRLPETVETLWETLLDLPDEERMRLFAHCVSLTIHAVRTGGRSPRALGHADHLAQHLGLDMTSYWRATAESYFGRVSKGQIIEAVSEALSPQEAAKLTGLKKDAMATAAADLLGSEGWLPPLLRSAAAVPA
jgi:ParB family chromosome partitioning protein